MVVPLLHPKGMLESSRGLSEAIPPVCGLNARTPKGCQKMNRKERKERREGREKIFALFVLSAVKISLLCGSSFLFWHPFGVLKFV